ncbi:MAG: amidohydrolase family protein [Thaumarchaeota archaeon]|nr:amidohydrolase family protein [Nitrososphaerota archaeon]
MPPIIDAHLHCSELPEDGLWTYAKFNGLEYTLKELLGLMERNGVEKGLLLSPPMKKGPPVPNERILELCARSGGLLHPVVTAEPKLREVEKVISLARKNKEQVKGFKIRLGYMEVFAHDRVFNKLYDFAEKQDLPVLFHTGDTATSEGSLVHSHPLTLDSLANKRPGLKIVVCHFGNPWISDVGELLYKHANVYADVSGLVAGNGGTYSSRYMDSLASKISDAVYFAGGADKILFGTDYPVETFSDGIALINRLQIDEEDRQKIFYNNSKRLFFSDA